MAAAGGVHASPPAMGGEGGAADAGEGVIFPGAKFLPWLEILEPQEGGGGSVEWYAAARGSGGSGAAATGGGDDGGVDWNAEAPRNGAKRTLAL